MITKSVSKSLTGADPRHLVMENDHSEADALCDQVLSSTIFSFQTNRNIFRGMIRFSDHYRWKQVFDRVLRKSRCDLPHVAVETHHARSFEYVVDYLVSRARSRPGTLDPTGELNLRLAKKVRRLTMARGGSEDPIHLQESTDEFFPPPTEALIHWPRQDGLAAITE